jgi:DNA modification methylase
VQPYFEDESATIYCGDSAEILPTIAAGSVHMVCTDPPYVIGAVSSGALGSKSGGWQDMMNSAAWFTSWYREVDRMLKRNGSFWSFLNWRTLPVVMRAAVDAGLPITSLAVWDKEWIGPGGVQGLRPSYELIALLAQPDFAVPNRGVADVFRHKVGSFKPNGHPAEKPVPIVRRVMEVAAVPPGGLVVDPFMGSGTAAVAARDLGLQFVGIEAEEKWCEVAASRLAQGDLFGDVA